MNESDAGPNKLVFDDGRGHQFAIEPGIAANPETQARAEEEPDTLYAEAAAARKAVAEGQQEYDASDEGLRAEIERNMGRL